MGSARAEEAELGQEERARGGNPLQACAPRAGDGAGHFPAILLFCPISGDRGQRSGAQFHPQATFSGLFNPGIV